MIFNANRKDLNMDGKIESMTDSDSAGLIEMPRNRQKMQRKNEAGFSLIEMMIVFAMLLIFAGISFYYLSNQRTAYRSDDQALQVVDILQTARQYALNKRRTMRVEVNITNRVVRLIDENLPGNANDDSVIKTITIPPDVQLRSNRRPANISAGPNEVAPAPDAVFANSVYGAPAPVGSTGQNVFTLRFLRNGTVTDGGTDAIATNAANTGATLYFYVPASPADLDNAGIGSARAITVLSAGAIRLWYQIPPSNVTGGIYWTSTH